MKTKYDWSVVPDQVNVITTDKFGRKEYWCMWDGELPKVGATRFYDDYKGRCIDVLPKSEFNGDWKDSLEVRGDEQVHFVTGQYLDNIGALYDVHRQVIIESDQDYRNRILIKLREIYK